MQRRRTMPGHQGIAIWGGFTLVELLVVIGIIAVLIAILLPTLGRAKEQANRIKCLANLRSLAQSAIIYTNDNKGRWPLPAMSIGYQRDDPQYITHEMYAGMKIGPDFVDPYTNLPNGKPLSPFFQCPSFSTYSSQVFQWIDVANPANAPAGSGWVVTSSTYLLLSSYVYCANGWGPLSGYNTMPNQASTGGATWARDVPLPVKFGDKGLKPLFADKTEWDISTGFRANHGMKTSNIGPSTDGWNVCYTDGHGEWVVRKGIILQNPATGPAGSNSNPAMAYPPALTVPRGYPAMIHMGTSPYFAVWYW